MQRKQKLTPSRPLRGEINNPPLQYSTKTINGKDHKPYGGKLKPRSMGVDSLLDNCLTEIPRSGNYLVLLWKRIIMEY